MDKALLSPSWRPLLHDEMQKDYFVRLWQFVAREYGAHRCYPPMDRIFAALNEWPLSEVRAVILGQDPYHEEGQAEGLAFSYGEGLDTGGDEPGLFGEMVRDAPSRNPRRWPPSLRNILREVSDDTGAPMPADGSLRRWARQGVLLLNATLTVRQGQPNSHAGKGWEQFTDAVISLVNRHCDHVVFFLWGSHAQKKSTLIDTGRHLVMQSAHPSPLSAHRGFFGNHQFSRANKYLSMHGKGEVEW